MHGNCKVDLDNLKTPCGKDLDSFGDHAVNCPIGGHFFTRHTVLNDVLAQVGRAAGYQTLIEQVVPDFARWKRKQDGSQSLEEARFDVELFRHPVAPTRYLDGTIRQSITTSAVSRSAQEVGFVAAEGERVKTKRYGACNVKEVIACPMETWGQIGNSMEALLREFAVLASNRQRGRGVQPTKWYMKWMMQISMNVAIHVGKCLLEAVPSVDKYKWSRVRRPWISD